MEVVLKSTKRRVKKKIERDHYWYDPESRQRLHGKGGKMIFVYDTKNKKSVPRIVDAEDWVYEESYPEIEKWVNDNGVQVTETTPGRHITINVDAANWSDIEDDLYRNKIIYDYDERQLKEESKGRESWQNSPSKWQIHQHY